MVWNHRVIKKTFEGWPDISYGIHEVFIDDGEITMYTEDPVMVIGESMEDLAQTLEWMTKALGQPVLEYGKITKEEIND